MRTSASILLLASVLFVTGSATRADSVVLDQIPSSPASLSGVPAYTSQNFGSPFTKDNVAVVDDFTVTSTQTQLTEIDAAVLGFSGSNSTSYSAITGWQVEVYSSISAASSNLTGDVAAVTVASASVTLTKPYDSDTLSALAAIPLDITLPSAGTYYIGVIPDLNYTSTGGAEIGVYGASNLGTPGGNNAFQVNPGGGFGYTNNQNALGVDAAYRVIAAGGVAVPLPAAATAALPLLAALGALHLLRRNPVC